MMLPARVAIVGGGLAGLAAAVRLVEEGVAVELFEARRRLGGRAGSSVPASPIRDHANPSRDREGAVQATSAAPPSPLPHGHGSDLAATDYGQHISMGCCTALADLLRRTSLADTFETHRRLHLFGPERQHHSLCSAGWLPAPLHLLPSLLGLGFLSVTERWHIVRAMRVLKRLNPGAAAGLLGGESLPAARCRPPATARAWAKAQRWPSEATSDEPIGDWLRRHAQSQRAIDRFWSPLLVSALAETPDCVSLRAAAKVIADGLLGSRHGYELMIPRLPLAEIFDRRLGGWLESHGATIHRLSRVTRVEGNARRVNAIVVSPSTAACCPLPAACCAEPDAVILAVPWDRVGRLLSPELAAAVPGLDRLGEIAPAAITTVHVAYDRPIMTLPHAALVGRLAQWVFAKPGNRYEVVISASHRLVDVSRDELGRRVERELAEVFPMATSANVIHRRVTVQPRAVFSACPGIDRLRLPQATPIENLALAGDWTATGWPATMESAIRSGVAAAEILRSRRT